MKKIKPTSNGKNANNAKGESIDPASIDDPKIDAKQSDPPNNTAEDNKHQKLEFWNKADTMERTQIILILLNIATLISFIVVGIFQIHHSSKTLGLADSSNVHTRESVELTRQPGSRRIRPTTSRLDVLTVPSESPKEMSISRCERCILQKKVLH
jgi:hypothetical protein